MHELTLADKIWNRACMGSEQASTPGDSALEAMLGFHAGAMNGGVLHSVECFSPEDLEMVKNGYRYFGIDEISELIRAAQASLRQGTVGVDFEQTLDRKYWERIPDDDALVQAFEAHYQSNPESYAPVVAERKRTGVSDKP